MAWLQAAERGEGIPAARAGGRVLPGRVLDLDATLITSHSQKDQAAPTYRGGFGFHPLLCFLANTGEAMSGRLRPGNAGANTAADHITVFDQALAQIPDAHRHGTDILVRTDSAGSARASLSHVRDMRKRGIRTFVSVGYAVTESVRDAIRAVPDRLWHPALDQDGSLRADAEVTELTGMVELTGYPGGTRIIVRRERPHSGAQLSLFDQDEGLRHQVFLTDAPYSGGGSAQFLEVRPRGHATVEDHIRCGKDTGFGRFPSRHFAINADWLELSLAAIDLPGPGTCCWTESWPTPSRRSSVTDCCTSPPASPAAADASTCGSPPPGPGDTTSPPRSTDSRLYPAQPFDQQPLTIDDPRNLENPTTAPGSHLAHPPALPQATPAQTSGSCN